MKTVTEAVRSVPLRSLLTGFLPAAAAFLLSGAALDGLYSPWALAAVSAAGVSWPGLSALLGDWPEVSVEMKSGRSVYRLVCRADAREVRLDGKLVDADEIEMVDDGRNHEAVFPPRREEKRQEKPQWEREAALR